MTIQIMKTDEQNYTIVVPMEMAPNVTNFILADRAYNITDHDNKSITIGTAFNTDSQEKKSYDAIGCQLVEGTIAELVDKLKKEYELEVEYISQEDLQSFI